jgi:hypothetical protein
VLKDVAWFWLASLTNWHKVTGKKIKVKLKETSISLKSVRITQV